MQFKLAFIGNDRATLQKRSADSPDVRALLWEVKRFRALALYVD